MAYEYTIDEIYHCDFEEFCHKTFTTPETFVKAIRAELVMLKIAREKYREKYMRLKWDDQMRDYYEGLILEINKRIERKTEKLRKYRKFVTKLRGRGHHEN